MMDLGIYIVLTLLATGMWIPVIIRFYRGWSERQNPISLAICGLAFLAWWETIARIWVISGDLREDVAMYIFTALSIGAAVNFHISFWRAKKIFIENKRR